MKEDYSTCMVKINPMFTSPHCLKVFALISRQIWRILRHLSVEVGSQVAMVASAAAPIRISLGDQAMLLMHRRIARFCCF